MSRFPRLRVAFKGLVTLGILAVGAAVALYFVQNRPHVERGERPKPPPVVVETTALRPTTVQASITAMGTVQPAQKTVVRAQVGGTVTAVHAQWGPGGRVVQGETLVRIDPADYRLAVKRKESALAQAEADLALEQGQQEIARREWDMARRADNATLNRTPLALRKPQLKKARAQVQSAQADLEQARLDLRRTTITAPYDGLILERHVDRGTAVSAQGQLATLVGTKTYWIAAQVPVDRLVAMCIPPGQAAGTDVTVRSQTGSATWQGQVLRCTGSLSGQARMAEVLIAVPDPLGLETNQEAGLLLGDYVEVIITGRSFEQVARVPREALHQGNQVWLYRQGNLRIKTVDVLWKSATDVIVPFDFDETSRLIVSDLTTPVEGMSLRRTGLLGEGEAANATQTRAENAGGDS